MSMPDTYVLLEAAEIASRHSDNHPFKVAGRLVANERDDIIVALLHDSLEDGYATEEEIKELFGLYVLAYVKDLTRGDEERYFDYIERIKLCGGRPLRVKIADVQENYSRCAEKVPPDSRVHRYEKAMRILNERSE